MGLEEGITIRHDPNFAEALRDFFRHREQLLKTVAHQLAGAVPPSAKAPAAKPAELEGKRRHAKRVALHRRIWKLFRAGQSKEEIARIVGVSSRRVYRTLKHEQPPARRRRSHTRTLTDPYLSYLSHRWNEGCHTASQLYKEIVAQGYTGSLRTMRRTGERFRRSGTKRVSRQTVTQGKAPSARSVALRVVRPAQNRTKDQIAYLDQLCKQDAAIATAFTLAQAFGQLLRKLEGPRQLEHWKAAIHASGLPELMGFVDGLADDAEAVVNGCIEPWSNGMVEGFINKVKWIQRSSYGQAGFALLQRRVLLHPAAGEAFRKEQRRRSSRKSAAPPSLEASRVRSRPLTGAATNSA
jgi:transposase